MIDKELVGMNIRRVRTERSMSQRELANRANISPTQLSSYENGKNLPGLVTLAEIASALGVSIDELCYGDASESFIRTASSEGKAIANSLVKLYGCGVIGYVGETEVEGYCGTEKEEYLSLNRSFAAPVSRLTDFLYDFQHRRETFDDPGAYLQQFINSVAREMDATIERLSQ